jgi:hypothetical protein
MTLYRGYRVSQSLNGLYWFGIPDRDLTTEHKITAATAVGLRAAIDEAVDGVLNPWELSGSTLAVAA